MAELKKPSKPTVNGKTVSVESIVGAVKYTLYRIKYILVKTFALSDESTITTSDGQTFRVMSSGDHTEDIYKSSYTGEQIDEAVSQALSESST